LGEADTNDEIKSSEEGKGRTQVALFLVVPRMVFVTRREPSAELEARFGW
jgi:hypothetical protein